MEKTRVTVDRARILVADDDSGIREILQEMLERAGLRKAAKCSYVFDRRLG